MFGAARVAGHPAASALAPEAAGRGAWCWPGSARAGQEERKCDFRGAAWDRWSRRAPLEETSALGERCFEGKTHRAILRLQGLDALGDIAIIDVAAVNLHEMLEGRGFVAGGFVGGGQFVVQSGAGFFVDAGSVEGLLVPANGCLGQALVEEALREPGVSLHDLREGMPAFDRLAGLLQLADGFIEQAHFAEGDAEVVVGFRILFGGGSSDFEIVFEFAEHFGEIDASILAEGRRLGRRRSAGSAGRNLWRDNGSRFLRSRSWRMRRSVSA